VCLQRPAGGCGLGAGRGVVTGVVTEIFDCSRVPEDERVDIDNGNIWVESMTRTLERLDGLCAGQPDASAMPD
jgi:hypothetical protein